MGWNSWDCFATTVTEAQVKAQADYMAANLAHLGWQYVVVDIQWYEPNATGFHYREGAELALDAFGRLRPAIGRFASAQGDTGFKSLSDYVHALGLKFGLHLLRGIPRRAVAANLPILGRSERAADIAVCRVAALNHLGKRGGHACQISQLSAHCQQFILRQLLRLLAMRAVFQLQQMPHLLQTKA